MYKGPDSNTCLTGLLGRRDVHHVYQRLAQRPAQVAGPSVITLMSTVTICLLMLRELTKEMWSVQWLRATLPVGA